MFKEFWLTYLKRIAMLLPMPMLFVILTPAPVDDKILGISVVLICLFVVQVVELNIIYRNQTRAENQRAQERAMNQAPGRNPEDPPSSRRARRRREQ